MVRPRMDRYEVRLPGFQPSPALKSCVAVGEAQVFRLSDMAQNHFQFKGYDAGERVKARHR